MLNKELNIATSEPGPVRRLEKELFDVDFERSVELTEPLPERWSDYLIEILGTMSSDPSRPGDCRPAHAVAAFP